MTFKNGPDSGFHHVVFHGVHHLFVALVLASAVFVLEQKGLLNWLDSIALRTVGSISTGNLATGDARLQAAPRVVLIGDRYFEREFRQESPLDRNELASLVARLREQRPTLLAIDIDLSPGPHGARSNEGQGALDDQLRGAVQSGIPVVLTAPFPVAEEELLRQKQLWMQRLCDSGVQFALAHVPVSQGLALRYSALHETLGVLAQRVARDGSSQIGGGSMCRLVGEGPEMAVFLSKAFPIAEWFGADDHAAQRPINSDFLKRAVALTRVLDGPFSAGSASGLAARPLFLGAAFDTRDEFLTSHGTFGGTLIHAATYFSEQNPAKSVTHGIAITLDLFFGVAAGYLFSAVWSRANRAEAQREADPGALRGWLLARGWQLLCFGALAGWLVILFLSSAWLLRHDLWNNPGPMLIGVFVKTLIASRHGIGGGHSAEHPSSGRSSAASVVPYLDWLLVSPIVVWAAVLFFAH